MANKRILEKIRAAVGPGGLEALRESIRARSAERRRREAENKKNWLSRDKEGLIKPEERRSNFLGERKPAK